MADRNGNLDRKIEFIACDGALDGQDGQAGRVAGGFWWCAQR